MGREGRIGSLLEGQEMKVPIVGFVYSSIDLHVIR